MSEYILLQAMQGGMNYLQRAANYLRAPVDDNDSAKPKAHDDRKGLNLIMRINKFKIKIVPKDEK